ncbi:MAG: diphthine--ammonia ligase [Planctomycetes bacterium]|nr:diphthine--ammonia ligase [Planctomycetota bacterium]
MGTKAILSWSGGKDSTMALYEIRRADVWEIHGLLTTVTRDYDRVCMHGVRTALLDQQAAALGLPLDRVYLDANGSQEAYEAKMKTYLAGCRARGIQAVIFGDLFLEDVRQYRERNLAQVGIEPVFPLWGQDTRSLAERFLRAGFQAIITCVDLRALPSEFVGRPYDRAFLADLPPRADPCGERGEFHSFVYDGPLFRSPIPFQTGRTVIRDNRFAYLDLVPSETGLLVS